MSRYHIVQFRRTYQIVSTRRTQLSWMHYRQLIYIGNPEEGSFYRSSVIVGTVSPQLSWYHCLASLIRFPMPNRWILIVVSLMRELCMRCVQNLTSSVSELNFLIFAYLRGNLYQIVKFYRCYEKVASPMPQLSWYHYLIFIKISNNQKKWIKIVGSATRQLCVL